MVVLKWLVSLALAALAMFAAYEFSRRPVQSAVITPQMNVHRAISSQLDARVDRLLHDRPPIDRSGNPRLVALTFDDGPFPVETPLLLDMLAELRVPATFFLIGRDAVEYPELTRRIATAGHEIANHTATHPNLDALSDKQVLDQLTEGALELHRFVHDPAIDTMMRPPHGRFTEATARVVQRAGYRMVLWNDDPGDWRVLPPEEIAHHIELHATAPDILLLHSGRLATVQMLPEIVSRFRKAGFTFVTAGQLLRRATTQAVNHPGRLTV